MPSPKERLCHLLELAAQGPSERAALAGEVADLLLDWPAQYPAAMRGTFEALLEKIVREVDTAGCAALAARFEGRADFPLSLLNAFFASASPAMKQAILSRNDEGEAADVAPVDSQAVLGAARGQRDFVPVLAHLTGIPPDLAAIIAADAYALATLCKGAGISRPTFSAMAILTGPARSVAENFAMLALFDAVPQNGARHLVAYWRGRNDGAGREAAA